MTAQNLFEKYGIKEVADVTVYRIEKKKETYESQRKVSFASVLKGAVELRTVYPMERGISGEDGFEAYVFTDADIITGTNYDCDDNINATATITGSFSVVETLDTQTSTLTIPTTEVKIKFKDGENALKDSITAPVASIGIENYTNTITIRDVITKRQLTIDELEDNNYELLADSGEAIITYKKGTSTAVLDEDTNKYTVTTIFTFSGNFTGIQYQTDDDLTTGVYTNYGRDTSDLNREVGTHEYTYAEQAFMLFAKRQNLITKTGTRYRFLDVGNKLGNLVFEDLYAATPNSTDRIVVLGPADSVDEVGVAEGTGSWSEGNYDIDDILNAINALTDTLTTKAYDVVYNSYAELVVEDEMGYYNPNFLGVKYNKSTKSLDSATAGVANYITAVTNKRGVDFALAQATMWGEGEHYSINDAIDALRQQQKLIDADDTTGSAGVAKLFGGYKVTDKGIPTVGNSDIDSTYDADYKFTRSGTEVAAGITSKYNLDSVLEALTSLAYIDEVIGQEVEVDYTIDAMNENAKASNRAIYVNTADANAAARSFIYLLHNKNYRRLSSDTEGIFTFTDKKGNKLYYQDKIFATVEWLALVIIGTKGLIFVVNRHGNKSTSKIAWMVGDNGFISDKQAEVCTKNGLIHTTDITVGDETFEATCAVESFSTRKIKKTVNHYVPVLFLDTLKISTLEQTAEETYATGGRGNANLIGWDFGKEITLTMQDALFTPASMSAIYGSYEGSDFRNGVKDAKTIDRMEKVIAKRSFIVPAGNQNGTPTEADKTAQAVFYDPNTMEPYADGTPIAEGEMFLKFTRSVAYEGQSIGNVIEISADKFPGTYKIVGDTFVRSKTTGEDERFQFVVPQAKMQNEQTITLEADGDPSVFDMNMTVLRPDDGVMVRFIQYNVIENEEENDGSTMVKGTENLNLLDDAELYRLDSVSEDEEVFIGATEY